MTKKRFDYLAMGLHSLEAIVLHSPKRLIEVYALKPTHATVDRKTTLLKDIQSKKIPIRYCSKKELENLCQSTSHQGIVGVLKKRETINLETFIQERPKGLVLALDSISDPHNLGAILRASECFKVPLVLWSKNRSAPLSPVVTKTSSSASEFVPISIVSNLSGALEKLAKAGYTLIGAQCSSTSVDLYDYNFPERCVLVLGSEGKGLRALLQKKLDESVSIKMLGVIDSLNVSQAAAVCLSKWSSDFYSAGSSK